MSTGDNVCLVGDRGEGERDFLYDFLGDYIGEWHSDDFLEPSLCFLWFSIYRFNSFSICSASKTIVRSGIEGMVDIV